MKKRGKRSIKHAVVLVNYNGWQDTLVCIKSIKQSKDTPHIIVVDNGSTDESIKELRTSFPDLDIIETKNNLGFSAGNNIGIKKALKMGAKVVHLLNNDTEVDPNLFFRAYRYVESKNRIATAKIYYAKGYEYHSEQKNLGNVIWYAGGYMDWVNVVARHDGVDQLDQGQFDKVRPVEFITGCYMAIPKQVFNKIGLLDESFFLYLEDTDYSLRAQTAGIELMYNPSLVVYHRNGGSAGAGSSLVDYYMTRNRFYLGKHYGKLKLRLALWREALIRNWHNPIRRAAFVDYLAGHTGNRNAYIKGIMSHENK